MSTMVTRERSRNWNLSRSRAIIHNSDYPSVDAATEAIDRYFEERNRHYRANPKRAGKKIWGLERTEAVFESGNNCKDPAYR